MTRVLTPGTLVDEALLDEGRTNHVAAIELPGPGRPTAAALSVIELSTGSFWLLDVPADRIEATVRSLSEHLGWDITRGAKTS